MKFESEIRVIARTSIESQFGSEDAVANESRLDESCNDSQTAVLQLFDVRPVDKVLPKRACHAVMLEYLGALIRVLEPEKSGPLVDPIVEELGRLLTDTGAIPDFDVVGAAGSKAKRGRIIGNGPYQHPAAVLKGDER